MRLRDFLDFLDDRLAGVSELFIALELAMHAWMGHTSVDMLGKM